MARSLSVRQAAFVLQRSEMQTRRLIDRGVLACVGERRTSDGRQLRRISVESVEQALPQDGSARFRGLVIGVILAGRFKVSTSVAVGTDGGTR